MKETLKNTTIADRLLIFLMVGLSVSLFFVIREVLPAGSEVVIEVEGKPAYTFPLDEDRSLVIESKYGSAQVEIRGGRARIASASCPNRLCVKEGWVQQGVIVCLPSRIAVFVGTRGGPPGKGIDAKTG